MSVGEEILAAAAGLTRAWTRAYTAGLPPSLRDRRRAEIDADVWDLVDDVRSSARSDVAAAAHVLARCLLGVADDLAWRVDGMPPRAFASPVFWTSTAMLLVIAAGVWLAAATRIELPPPAPMMTFVEAPPPPPPPPPSPPDLR